MASHLQNQMKLRRDLPRQTLLIDLQTERGKIKRGEERKGGGVEGYEDRWRNEHDIDRCGREKTIDKEISTVI